jgi:hypothetical protein
VSIVACDVETLRQGHIAERPFMRRHRLLAPRCGRSNQQDEERRAPSHGSQLSPHVNSFGGRHVGALMHSHAELIDRRMFTSHGTL